MSAARSDKQALQRAITLCETQTELARRLTEIMGRTVKQQNINRFLTNKGPLNPEFAIPIERAVEGQVTRYELAPHIYPPDEAASAR